MVVEFVAGLEPTDDYSPAPELTECLFLDDDDVVSSMGDPGWAPSRTSSAATDPMGRGNNGTDNQTNNLTVAGIHVAQYNIRHGGNCGIEETCKTSKQMNLDIVFMGEVKKPAGVPTPKSYCGYEIHCSIAESHHRGGVAIAFRHSKYWQVESIRMHGPNVVSAVLVTGFRRHPMIGAYIPPNDLTTLDFIDEAMERYKDSEDIILLGDLNADLSNPRDGRSAQVSDQMATYGFDDMLRHFKQRGRYTSLATWRQRRHYGLVTARCDYVLARDRRMFTNVAIRQPRKDSDHNMIVATLRSAPIAQNRAYPRSRKQFPLSPPQWGPRLN